MSYSNIGLKVGQRVIDIINDNPLLGQHWPTVRSTLIKCRFNVKLCGCNYRIATKYHMKELILNLE